ncbi:hypothetical protein GGD61_001121 [Bradyrhizobium sp. SBR1B]|nr:hypothetical protein [Bradyrhizobium sp. SBR1B]
MIEKAIDEFMRSEPSRAFAAHNVSAKLDDISYLNLYSLRRMMEPVWRERGFHVTMSDVVGFCIYQTAKTLDWKA